MKKLFVIAILMVFNFDTFAQNPSEQDLNIMTGSLKAVEVYKQSGMSGLFEEINKCYTSIINSEDSVSNDAVEICVTLDMSAVFLDYSMAKAAGFPRDQRFTDEVASSRIHVVLEKLGVSREISDTQRFLDARNERVQTYTNSAMLVSSNKQSEQGKQNIQEKCVKRKMAAWGKKQSRELDKWCADLAKQGEECRVSASSEEMLKEEATNDAVKACRNVR